MIGESRISTLVIKNVEYVIKELINFNQKYKKYLGKFIYSINTQKNAIYKRLNLVQKKFRDFLNYETEKKKVIHIYVKKYNGFFKDRQIFFESPKAIEEFSEDIEEVNNNLWILVNEKEKESIQELDSIKNCGFIEKELEKFYENIKELSLIETERFLIMINSIIYLYSNGNKNINNIKKEESNNIVFNNNNKRDSKNFIQFNNKTNNNNEDQNYGKDLNEIYYDKNYIIKNTSDINLDPEKTTDSFKNTTNNINLKNILNKSRKESKNKKLINNLIYQISNNIEIIFLNCIKLI